MIQTETTPSELVPSDADKEFIPGNEHVPVIEARSRKDSEANHTLVTKAFYELLKANGRIPTQHEIAEHTGLARVTVQRHLQTLSFAELSQSIRPAAPRVLATIVGKALAGNDSALKLFCNILKEGDRVEQKFERQPPVPDSPPESLRQMSDEELLELAEPFVLEWLDKYPSLLQKYYANKNETATPIGLPAPEQPVTIASQTSRH